MVTLLLAALGFLTIILRPFVAPPPENKALVSRDAFLSRASRQLVDWQLLSKEALATARRQEKPILLMIGVSSSGIGQDLDEYCFTDSEVARYMNANFICIRVDGLDSPELLNGFLPLSRMRIGLLPEIQLWILDPAGNVTSFVGPDMDHTDLTRDSFLDSLVAAISAYRSSEASGVASHLSGDQLRDQTVLSRANDGHLPDFERYTDDLIAKIDAKHGGFPDNNIQRLRPEALRYLFQFGHVEEAQRALLPMAKSPMFDLQDGGFFRLSSTADYSTVEFNKEASANAEMLTVLGLAETETKEPIYGYLGRQTFDLLDGRMRSAGQIAAFQVENKPRDNRSDRYSFNLRRMRDTLSEADRTWTRDHLGLDIPRNPQMVPFLTDGRVFERKGFYPILHKLRMSNAKAPRHLVGTGYLEQEGYVAARMVEWARLVGDDKRLHRAMMRVRSLERFIDGDGLARKLNPGDENVPGKLTDYLAFADAMLQAYLAGGSLDDEEAGRKALTQAQAMFRADIPGLYRLTIDDALLSEANSPEIVDNLRSSTSAQMIRLLTAYGRLSKDTTLLDQAREIVGRFSAVAEGAGGDMAGYYSAAGLAADSTYALVVGPQAERDAAELQRLRPARFVGIGMLRPDLKRLSPGVYLISSNVAGPFSVDGAALLMPANVTLP